MYFVCKKISMTQEATQNKKSEVFRINVCSKASTLRVYTADYHRKLIALNSSFSTEYYE